MSSNCTPINSTNSSFLRRRELADKILDKIQDFHTARDKMPNAEQIKLAYSHCHDGSKLRIYSAIMTPTRVLLEKESSPLASASSTLIARERPVISANQRRSRLGTADQRQREISGIR